MLVLLGALKRARGEIPRVQEWTRAGKGTKRMRLKLNLRRWTFRAHRPRSGRLWSLTFATGMFILAGNGGPQLNEITDRAFEHFEAGVTHLKQYRLEDAGSAFTETIKTFEEARELLIGQKDAEASGSLKTIDVGLADAHLGRGDVHYALANYLCATREYMSARMLSDIENPPSDLAELASDVFKKASQQEAASESKSILIWEGRSDCSIFKAP